jgi:hypothetical protein
VKSKLFLILALLMVILIASMATADDGQMFRRNISDTPDTETEEAGISIIPFYVPAQMADGTPTTIEYYGADGALVDTRDQAKPLVAVYIDGIEVDEPTGTGPMPLGGASFGERDAFAAVSLDDGATWKDYNLSRSADLSSFTLANGHVYPGDVHLMEHYITGNKVLAVWLSKYCEGGSPAYTLKDAGGYPIFEDLFGVAGAQGSVNYTLQGYPEVGEIPYSCVWTARGTLELDDTTGTYDILWRHAERLTSGRRDANVVAVAGPNEAAYLLDGVYQAGFAVVWQEDPSGLRPGQGLGPGEGWSGAIVNSKTDMWYSYISWDDFDACADTTLGTEIDCVNDDTNRPKALNPMSMPVRLTDNNMCKATGSDPYCYADLDNDGFAYDLCRETVQWTNPGGTTLTLCKSEDGRVLWGRTGASRTRMAVHPYTKANGTVSAWVVLAYEETKALGEGSDPTLDPIDIGKDIYYHSFDMFEPDLVAQGSQLNQPAVDRMTGTFYELQLDDWGNEFYETEIARRFSIISQNATQAGPSGTVLTALFKQGIINQGGPADILVRRFVVPDPFDPGVDNPYAFENMVCDNWVYTDGSNPLYVNGLCLDPAINVSGTNIEMCDNGSSGQACADAFPWDGGEVYPKVIEWSQTPDNLDDQAWANPYDVSKGHRGFIDGDFIMMIYAWSPNWHANSVGNDHYNLYVRRSFDGGQTWTTTPAALGGDGTETCENYGLGNATTQVCTFYGAGEFEQARNVSQLIGNKITILDPRYTPTLPTIADGPYWDDVRDHSKFFLVYETGDNTTVAVGEAVPLDLYYSRATAWGDDYFVVEYYNQGTGVTSWGFDWLENKIDDLSGEAAVRANSGGTFFYADWNQWQEPEEEVIENSDCWFRRVFFLETADAMPVATILHVSHPAADHSAGNLSYFGTARDLDQIGAGIVAYQWRSSIDGLLSTQSSFSIPVTSLSDGLHFIYFTAKDNEGNWAPEVRVPLLVADPLYTGRMPLSHLYSK